MLQCQALAPEVRHQRLASTLVTYRPGWMPGKEMMRYLLMVIVAVLSICGCFPKWQPTPQLAEEDQIRQTVFRYQFEFNASGLGQAANAYHLSVEGSKDPSAQLLMQFDGHHHPVKPLLASELEAGTAQVLDKESGLPGLILNIGKIRWLSDSEVEVQGGYEEASESGAASVYHLEREGGCWEAIGSQMRWIK